MEETRANDDIEVEKTKAEEVEVEAKSKYEESAADDNRRKSVVHDYVHDDNEEVMVRITDIEEANQWRIDRDIAEAEVARLKEEALKNERTSNRNVALASIQLDELNQTISRMEEAQSRVNASLTRETRLRVEAQLQLASQSNDITSLTNEREEMKTRITLLQKQLQVEMDGRATAVAQLRDLEGSLEARELANRQHNDHIKLVESQSKLIHQRIVQKLEDEVESERTRCTQTEQTIKLQQATIARLEKLVSSLQLVESRTTDAAVPSPSLKRIAVDDGNNCHQCWSYRRHCHIMATSYFLLLALLCAIIMAQLPTI